MPGEFEIISRHFSRSEIDDAMPIGVGDDGALLRPTPGHELVVVTDTLVEGRHFPADTGAADIGWRALAVNLSDCAAMAATPRWAFLNISLPQADDAWLDALAGGFFALAGREGVKLAGGDTTRGPLCITVTVLGEVPQGNAVRRSGAVEGDAIYVTGWPGRARAALEYWRRGEPVPEELQVPWLRPEPRLDVVPLLREFASAAIDVSDGLVADLGHVLAASGVGALLDAESLPVAPALEDAVGEDAVDYVLHGGDDYEILFTVAASAEEALGRRLASQGLDVHRIGRIDAGEGLRLATSDGEQWELPLTGFDHFAEGGTE